MLVLAVNAADLALNISAAAAFLGALGGFIVVLRQRSDKPIPPSAESPARHISLLIDLLADKDAALDACETERDALRAQREHP